MRSQIILNYSLILLIIIEYSIVLYDMMIEKRMNKRYIHSEILGFITLSLLLYNYYNFFYIKEIFIILMIFIIIRSFIFIYILSN
jgi:hypothetical protein